MVEMSRIRSVLQRRLWSDRTDDVLLCLAEGFLPALILVLCVASGVALRNPFVGLLAAFVLAVVLAAIGIWRRRSWGYLLAAALCLVVAVFVGWPRRGDWFELLGGAKYLVGTLYFGLRARGVRDFGAGVQ